MALSLAEPGENSMRRSDPDRTGAVVRGREATWLGFARAGLVFGAGLLGLGLLTSAFRGAGGVVSAGTGGTGGGGGALVLFGVDAGGNGGGGGAFGGRGAIFTAGGGAPALFGWTAAISGGFGTDSEGAKAAEGGGGETDRGFFIAGCGFFVGRRRTTVFFLVVAVRLTVLRTGRRTVLRVVALGGLNITRLVGALVLAFGMTGNFGGVRYGLLR